VAHAVHRGLGLVVRPGAGGIHHGHSLKAKLDVIEAIAKRIRPECDGKLGFLTLLNRTRRLSKFRNDLVHGELHAGNSKRFQLIVGNHRSADRFDVSDVSVADIAQHVIAVDRLATQYEMALTDAPERYVRLVSSRRTYPSPPSTRRYR
jgi:hypothetical protein